MERPRFETITLQDVVCWNEIFSGDIPIRWLDDFFLLRLIPAKMAGVGKERTGSGKSEKDVSQFSINLAGHRGLLNFWIAPRVLFAHMKKALGEDVAGDLLCLPDGIRNVVVDTVGEELIDRAGTALGLGIERVEAHPPMGMLSYGISIYMIHEETGHIEGRGELFLDRDGFQVLVAGLKGIPRKARDFVCSIPVVVGVLVGITCLSWGDLKSLDVGDIVLMDSDSGFGSNRLTLLIPPNQEFWVERQEEDRMVITGRKKGPMYDEAKELQDNEEMVRVSDIEVELRFEVGRKIMTIGELEKVGTGYVFTLDTPVERAVSLYANRRLIGLGELVEIDGRLGVRVLEMRNARTD